MQLNFQNGWFSASFLTGGLTLCPVNRHVPKLKSFASHSSHLPVIVVAATQQPLTECELPDTRCLLSRQRTQASVARAVVIQRKKIACHKVNSDARYVDIQRTPM